MAPARAPSARRALALATLLSVLAVGCDEGTRLGIADVDPEFVVNAFETGDQMGPVVVAAPDGRFLVVWESGCLQGCQGQDGSELGVFARRYDPDGRPLSGEFQVNDVTDLKQQDPAAAMLPDGSFAIAWAHEAGDVADAFDVRLKLYDENGDDLTGEIPVNAVTAGTQWRPKVALAEDGAALVVWEDQGVAGTTVMGRRFAADGAPEGAAVDLAGGGGGGGSEPDLAALPDGRGVLVFAGSAGYGAEGVTAQRLDGLSPVGVPVAVSLEATASYPFPRVALGPDGQFVVTWAGHADVDSDYDVCARAFDPEGVALTPELAVNEATAGFQQYPAVAISPGGTRFVVAWESSEGGAAQNEILAKIYRLDGEGAEVTETDFLVNSYQAEFQEEPSIAATREGFLIAWQSSPEVDVGYDVYVKLFPLWP